MAWKNTATVGVLAFTLGALAIVNLEYYTETAEAHPLTTSAEAAFARDMQNHHAQAIEMAVITRDRSSDAQIRELAGDLALSQQQEIGQMRALLAVWGLPSVGPMVMDDATGEHTTGTSAALQGMLGHGEINQLGKLPRNEVGVRFFELMIPHHEAGVVMAEKVVASTSDPVVRDLVTTILRVQRDEILLMKDLLRQRGVQTSH